MKKFFYLFLSFLIFVIIIKAFILDAYFVASDSMKNTLLSGDFVLGNKAAYKIKTPVYIPFTQIRIPSVDLTKIDTPKRNDIIVFRLNEFLTNSKYSDLDFIKRIVGLPGENFHLYNNEILINGNKIKNYFSIERKKYPSMDFDVYDFNEKQFSYLNYGPIKIPAKGDTIELNPKNIKFWQPLINFENDGKFISNEGTVITFKGKPINKYVFTKNYYFVLGDNLNNSVDSRILGLIPEDAIVAKVKLIYLSIAPNAHNSASNFLERIRFNRLFKIFN